MSVITQINRKFLLVAQKSNGAFDFITRALYDDMRKAKDAANQKAVNSACVVGVFELVDAALPIVDAALPIVDAALPIVDAALPIAANPQDGSDDRDQD